MKEITLSIEATENNLLKFGKFLCKTDENDLCSFKKNSKIAKELAQKCIDEEVIINLHAPRVGDSFKELGYMGYGFHQIPNGDTLYLKVDSKYLKADDTPVGFTEIKLSEFHKFKEESDNLVLDK